ncbi:uncharacterized protein TNCV_3554181 [Trichonephila clavipes]|nr:uncharacterized protein TNCV_3554181 [Trichonephila clavipes]
MELNLSKLQCPPVGVEVRRGGCQLRCHPRHMAMVQNDEVRARLHQNSRSPRKKCDECHSELVEALENNALPYRSVARWIGKFQEGRMSTSDMQRLGRLVSTWTDFARAVIEQLMDYNKVSDYVRNRDFQKRINGKFS